MYVNLKLYVFVLIVISGECYKCKTGNATLQLSNTPKVFLSKTSECHINQTCKLVNITYRFQEKGKFNFTAVNFQLKKVFFIMMPLRSSTMASHHYQSYSRSNNMTITISRFIKSRI